MTEEEKARFLEHIENIRTFYDQILLLYRKHLRTGEFDEDKFIDEVIIFVDQKGTNGIDPDHCQLVNIIESACPETLADKTRKKSERELALKKAAAARRDAEGEVEEWKDGYDEEDEDLAKDVTLSTEVPLPATQYNALYTSWIKIRRDFERADNRVKTLKNSLKTIRESKERDPELEESIKKELNTHERKLSLTHTSIATIKANILALIRKYHNVTDTEGKVSFRLVKNQVRSDLLEGISHISDYYDFLKLTLLHCPDLGSLYSETTDPGSLYTERTDFSSLHTQTTNFLIWYISKISSDITSTDYAQNSPYVQDYEAIFYLMATPNTMQSINIKDLYLSNLWHKIVNTNYLGFESAWELFKPVCKIFIDSETDPAKRKLLEKRIAIFVFNTILSKDEPKYLALGELIGFDGSFESFNTYHSMQLNSEPAFYDSNLLHQALGEKATLLEFSAQHWPDKTIEECLEKNLLFLIITKPQLVTVLLRGISNSIEEDLSVMHKNMIAEIIKQFFIHEKATNKTCTSLRLSLNELKEIMEICFNNNKLKHLVNNMLADFMLNNVQHVISHTEKLSEADIEEIASIIEYMIGSPTITIDWSWAVDSVIKPLQQFNWVSYINSLTKILLTKPQFIENFSCFPSTYYKYNWFRDKEIQDSLQKLLSKEKLSTAYLEILHDYPYGTDVKDLVKDLIFLMNHIPPSGLRAPHFYEGRNLPHSMRSFLSTICSIICFGSSKPTECISEAERNSLLDEYDKRVNLLSNLKRLIKERDACPAAGGAGGENPKDAEIEALVDYAVRCAPEEVKEIVNDRDLMDSLPLQEQQKIIIVFSEQGGAMLPTTPAVGSISTDLLSDTKEKSCMIM